MNGDQRRKAICEILQAADAPVSGMALGEQFDVSRQVVVQDIALLRTAGYDITSTNRGYILASENAATRRLVKVRHTPQQIEQEMNLVVDLGGTIEDVIVNHRTYGRMEATLNVKSRRDVKRFLDDLAGGVSDPISSVTNGYHFHHISAETPEILDEIVEALADAGFIAEFTDYELTTLRM